ncbi:SGNH hydrolase-type esterase domain-containing protein, partial [Chytriomyces sp. MP71]
LALDHILLLGDSITAYSARTNGYANHLRNEYTTKMDTIVRGFVGLNTRDALPLILPILQSTAPASPSAHTALVIAMLGSNDATNPDIPAAHVSLPDYTRNLIHIVSAIRDTAGPATRVLLLTPPFMSVDFMMHRTRETLKQYRDACLDAARQIKSDGSVWNRVNFSVLDTWDALLGGEGLGDKPYELTATRSLFEDGLHLSAKGNAILGKAIIAKIRADWDDLRKERMSNRLP